MPVMHVGRPRSSPKAEAPIRTGAGSGDAAGREFPFPRQVDRVRSVFNLAAQLLAQYPSQCGECRNDRKDGRQQENLKPGDQRRKLFAVHHQVGRIGDRQNEAGCVGDERADEKIRQRRCARPSNGGVHRGRQHNCSGVVRKKNRDDDSDRVDETEQTRSRTLRGRHCERGEPIEYTLAPRQFRKQHHAGQEEIDVCSFEYGLARLSRWDQPRDHQDCGA